MITPYEIVSKSALPALRAMVARRLRDEYGMTQQQIAACLGVTQASISNYARRTRGMMVNLESDSTVSSAADKIARELSSNYSDQRESLRLMTEVLDYIRFSHMMCELHSELEPEFQVEGCYACDGGLSARDFGRLRAPA